MKKWIVGGLVMLIIAVFAIFFLNHSRLKPIPFSADSWKKTSDVRKRGQMVQQLVQSRQLDGKTQKEVLELLGEPDSQSQARWEYKVDLGYRFVLDPWLYNLRVDFQDDVVSNVRLLD